MPCLKISTCAGQFIGFERHQIGVARQHRGVVLARWESRRGRRTCSRDTCPSGPIFSHCLRVHQLRGLDLVIARGVEPAAHVGLELAPQDEALGVPEHAAVRLGLEVEQVHVLADAAMVALGGFLEPDEMLVELLLVEPRGAVDAAEHRIGLVAAPVSPRHARQLERLRVELAGRGEVRAAAQVHPRRVALAAAIHGDRLALGQLHHPLGLEGLAGALEEGAHVLAAAIPRGSAARRRR